MSHYVLGFEEIDHAQVAVVGGKGAHLGELSRIEGIRVPAGFCVTTDAFQRIMAEAPSIDDHLDRLSRLKPDDREAIRALSLGVRKILEGITIPDDVAAAITGALARLDERASYAVRSSATAEDLPTASFAGQQDTYLNVDGPAAILQHVSICWASLFTERAVTYRLRNGFDHQKVHMAVVVQQMVFPQAAGILFTADPVTGNRKVSSIDASFGLGEALVSGLVNADVYKVRDGEIVAKAIATKKLAIHASPAGGTQEQAIEPARQQQPALTERQVVRLTELGQRIEAHFGRPHSDLVAFLQHVEDEDFLKALPMFAGGQEARDAIKGWLDKYGMRGGGEIDITRPRWSERPTMLLPLILGNVRNFEPGAGARRFEQGRQEALKKERELLAQLRALPDGQQKGDETKRMIDRVRTFAGYREYPKYGMVSRYFVYKQALMEEAERLVQARVLREKEDIFYLRFQELQDVVRTKEVDEQLIRWRKEEFRSYEALKPPRVLTSDGEMINGAYRRDDVPASALVGLAVSAGTIEGRARVILGLAEADLEAGDILVTAYTDPSWTPLFVAIKGLVTEVGA
jgi:phosphoenolpyruvate synthase/pyruvate phosphate dikinase